MYSGEDSIRHGKAHGRVDEVYKPLDLFILQACAVHSVSLA